MSGISLCMIVKNEEKMLRKCLESVSGYVDEIVIVDTGSTDRTKEIAAEFQAKIFDFKWNGNFSEARQFSKNQATKPWILQLDADEYLAADEGKKLKQICNEADVPAFNVSIFNYTGKRQSGIQHRTVRLFKNEKTFIYTGSIHEQITKNGEPFYQEDIKDSGIQVIHLGYMSHIVEDKNKSKRNLELLKQEVRKHPENGFHHYNLSNEYLYLEKYEKALEHAVHAFKKGGHMSYASAAALNVIRSYRGLGELKKALQFTQTIKEAFPDYTDLLFLEAITLEEMGRVFDAKNAYFQCIEEGTSENRYVSFQGTFNAAPFERLAAIAIKEKNLEEALSYYQVLLERDPHHPAYAKELVEILKLTNKEEEIVAFLDGRYPNDEKNVDFKYRISCMTGLKEGIAAYFPKWKESQTSENNQANFACLFGIEKWDRQQKRAFDQSIKEGNVRSTAQALASRLYQTNRTTKTILEKNKTCRQLISVLDGKNEGSFSIKGMDERIYVALVKELIHIQSFQDVFQLLDFAFYFKPSVLKKIGILLDNSFEDESAIRFFASYLQSEPNDFSVCLRLSELLFHHGLYEEAVIFSQKASQINKTHFRPLEIWIESMKQLNDQAAVKAMCQEALKTYPDSEYIANQI